MDWIGHTTVRMYLAVLATFGTAALVARAAGQPDAFTVLAVVVAVTSGRVARSGGLAGALTTALALPVVGLAAAGIGELLHTSLTAAGALYTVAVTAAALLRRFGTAAARIGRLATLPLLVVFIAPAPVAGSFGHRVAWSLLACAIAAAWVFALCVAPEPAGRALRAAARALPRARTAQQRRAAITRLDVEAHLLNGPGIDELRVAAFDAEIAIAADPPRGGEVLVALRDRALALTALGARRPPAAAAWRPAPRSATRRRIAPSTRLALQSGAATALGFAVGHRLFPDHWPWTIITVFAVTGAARQRGDVLHRSIARLSGALVGTTIATVLTTPLAGHRELTVIVILGLLGVGLAGRDRAYAIWAAAVTGVLALLYGLYGQTGSALLHTRLEAILVGALCALIPAWVVLPIRADAVARRRLGEALRAAGDALRHLRDGPLVIADRWRAFDMAAAQAPADRIAPIHAALRRIARDARAGEPLDARRIDALRGMLRNARPGTPQLVSSIRADGDHAHDDTMECPARRRPHRRAVGT